MEKVFLDVVAGTAEPETCLAVRSLLDFIHYAHFEMHTEESLTNMKHAWAAFHRYIGIYKKAGIRQHFNISKIHSMSHYVDAIRHLGTADGYSTDWSERLHIEFAKLAYRASSKKDYLEQMAVWLNRHEAVQRFQDYLEFSGIQDVTPATVPAKTTRTSSVADEEIQEELKIGRAHV